MSSANASWVRKSSLALCALLFAACSADRPELQSPVSTAPTTPVEPSGTPTVVISPTGVVVPVLSADGASYVVSTPCGNDASLSGGQPLRNIQVVIDPGHGGDERGATQGDLTEAAVNLAVAQQTSALLETQGITTALTRTSDYRIPITSRVAIIEALKPRAYISIHHNSANVEPSETPGTEVYPQSGSDDSRRLGGLIYQEVVDSLTGFDAISWISASEPGVISVLDEDGEDAYGIVRGPSVPGVLAELAYLSNPSEADFIASEEYQSVVSTALAEALAAFVSNPNARGSGFVDDARSFAVDNSTGGVEDCVDPDLV